MEIIVFTNNGYIYTTETNAPSIRGYKVITDCEISKTSYGSVIIERDSFERTLELYPSQILKVKFG